MWIAVSNGHAKCIEVLVGFGANINRPNKDGTNDSFEVSSGQGTYESGCGAEEARSERGKLLLCAIGVDMPKMNISFVVSPSYLAIKDEL